MNSKMLLLSAGNALLYLAMCSLIGTGLLLEFRMDEEDRPRRLLGMSPDDWGEVHLLVAICFVGLSLAHVLMNRTWICSALAKTRFAWVVFAAGMTILGALLLWPADTSWFPEWLD